MMFDTYLPRDSWLHRLDPRTKLILLAAFTVAMLIQQNLWLTLGWWLSGCALLAAARTPWSRVRGLWTLLLPVSLLVAFTWPLVYSEGGPLLLAWGPLRLTLFSVAHGLALGLRLNALAQLYFLLMLTTDQTALARGMVGLGLPYSAGLVMALAMRYVPTLYGTFQQIADAQQARGLRLDQGPWLARLRAYGPILTAMIITALRSADYLGRALEARALGAGPRTVYRPLVFTRRDGLVLAGGLLAALLLLGARLALGLGAHPLALGPGG